MNSLPLSWSTINNSSTSSVILNMWNMSWYALQEIEDFKISKIKNLHTGKNSNILIRGCNKHLVNELEKANFSSLQVGIEAVLNTSKPHFEKKSIRDLIKRGKRNGVIHKIPYSEIAKKKLAELQKLSSHGSEPQLKNLFQTEFNPNHKLFAFIDQNGNWLGAILTSKNSPEKIHTELLLRKRNAPAGIMESLVEYVWNDARINNFDFLSLGEVPFIAGKNKSKDVKSKLLWFIGNKLSFAYNYNGLFNFKNKFNPDWQNIYLCSSSKINFKHLYFVFVQSNFHKLSIFKSLRKMHHLISYKKVF